MYLKYPDKAAQFADEVRAFVRAHLPAEISDKVKKRQSAGAVPKFQPTQIALQLNLQ